VNSRLDTLQAAILEVKLKYVEEYTGKRNEVADFYDTHLANASFIELPPVPRTLPCLSSIHY